MAQKSKVRMMRIDEDNHKALKQFASSFPYKLSMAQLANGVIRKYLVRFAAEESSK